MNEADSLRMLGEHGETLTSNRKSRIVCDDDLSPTRRDDGRLSLVPQGDLLEQEFSQRRSNNNVVIGGSVLHRGDCR